MKVQIFVTKSKIGKLYTWVCEKVGDDTYEVSTYNQEGMRLDWKNRMSGSVLKKKLEQEPECISYCEHKIK